MADIDSMDIFFYFDSLIFRNIKKSKKITDEYDKKGL